MAERKEKPHGKRTFTFLQELSRYIIDRCDVVSINRMPHAEYVRNHSGTEKHRPIGERRKLRRMERAIASTDPRLEGLYSMFAKLKENGGGTITADLKNRKMTYRR